MKGQGRTEEDWQKVRRRKTQQHHNRFPERTSLYVSNIPVGIRKGDLWKTFKPLGKVVDVFIPDKKNKEGSFFCFIKFEGINDPQEFESALPELKIWDNTLKVNLAKFPRKPPLPPPPTIPKPRHPQPNPPQPIYARHRDHRSYAGAVSGTNATAPTEIPMKPVPGLANWYGCSQNLFGTPPLHSSISHPISFKLHPRVLWRFRSNPPLRSPPRSTPPRWQPPICRKLW
ncbi:hypothetical protein LXL04_023554 [Taraxacum kok-saghyz]